MMALVPVSALAYTNTPHNWGIRVLKMKQYQMQESYIQIYYKKWRVLFRRYEEKDIYLTFDNGYENGYTGKILDVLKEKKVPATFFVTGHYIKTQKIYC